jgi:small subunit ribosomal protein S17
MADEEKTEETPEATTTAEETAADAPESVVEEVETASSEEGAGDTSTVDAPEATEAAPEEPQEVLAPKERRARKRAAKAPAATGPKTAEERNADRLAARAHKAKLRRNYRQRAKTKQAEARKDQSTAEPDVAPEHGPGRAKVRQGVVVSDKADKTIIVRVDVTRRHRRYGKILRTSTKLHAHDERNDAGTGDTVRVVECRPMSRTKRWRLTDVLEKAK